MYIFFIRYVVFESLSTKYWSWINKYTHSIIEENDKKKSARIAGLDVGPNLKFEAATFWTGSQMTTAALNRSPTYLRVVETLGSVFNKTAHGRKSYGHIHEL
jgi:hypothetical protein